MVYKNDAREANDMRGKKRDKNKYDVGVTEVIQLIECYNPEVSRAILRCGLPFLTARKFVKKLINLSTKDYCEYEGPPFTGYLC
jgi:hypothetical protein